MQNRIWTIVTALVTVVLPLFSQVVLEKEEVLGSLYRLEFRNQGYSSSIKEINGRRTIIFRAPKDEALEAAYALPRKDLFIALPPNSRPNVSVVATSREIMSNVRPEIIPIVHRLSDSLHQYEQVQQAATVDRRVESFYRMNGYLWMGDYYCVHITVFPFSYDDAQNSVTEIREFSIEIALPPGNSYAAPRTSVGKNDFVINPQFGNRWKVRKPSYAIPPTDAWIDYTQEYLKIGVAKDGIYRLTYEDLQNYGIPVGTLNPKAFKLFLKGKEIPIYVNGENDNTFQSGDYIEFLGRRNYGDTRYRQIAPFGSSYYEFLNLYSDTTIYWLGWSGTFGKRIDTTVTVTGTPVDTTKYYDELLHNETNLYWDFSLSGGDVRRNDPALLENETWNDGTLGIGKLSIPFAVSDLYPNKNARAFVKLQDYSSDIQTDAHDLALSINSNSTLYDSGSINKYQVKVLGANFSSALLVDGTNTVNIHSFATQNTINLVIRDWYELEYPRFLKTSTDSLDFSYRAPNPPLLSVISVAGFTSASLSLYKFTAADSSIRKITNYTRSNDTVRFIDTVATGTYYFVNKESAIRPPIVFHKKKFINLRNTANKADYIAITHPYFQASVTGYLSFVSTTYGVTTKLIDVNDIYDEFNYGFLAPEPIRDFLMSTRVYWQSPSPKYVFLIGKATYDFYGYKSRYFGAPKLTNYVPSFGNPVSDNWFIIWDSTGAMIPQMSIGRLPAKNLDEFQVYAAKHQKYVSNGYDDWNKRYLFFSGGNFTDPDQLAQSKGVNDYIVANYVGKSPIGGKNSNFYKTVNPITNFGPYSAEYVKSAIDQGAISVCYIGHSGTQTWDNSITDVSQLTNARDRNPLICDFGCSTAKHAEPDILSFSELFVNDTKGQAIAYIGNSSLGFTSNAYSFPQVFYKKMLLDTSLSIGETHRLAKIEYVTQYGTGGVFGLFVETNSIIGDPIVKLAIPAKPNLSVSKTIIAMSPQRPTDQTDSVTIAFGYNNFGKVVGDTVDILIKDEYQGSVMFSATIKRKLPLFEDSISTRIPVKGKTGEHIFTIQIDPSNRYDEIYENDNSLTYKYVVASSSIRGLTFTQVANQTKGSIRFLNPTVKPPQSSFIVEMSRNSNFSPSQRITVPYDTFSTRLTIDTSYFEKRVWIKTIFDTLNSEGIALSYFVGQSDNFLVNDSTTMFDVKGVNTTISGNRLVLDSSRTTFGAISAGFIAGNAAVITKNGQNFIPENTLRGHHVCLFDATTFEFKGYYRFDTFAGPPADITNYQALLDTLTSQYVVVIAISSAGTNLTNALRASIKSLGSVFIDSVQADYCSWALIGRKGAVPGSVPERFSQPNDGRVQVDTTIVNPNIAGTFATEPIGPVSRWRSLEIGQSTPLNSQITYRPLAIRGNGTVDTLSLLSLSGTSGDLSFINASVYPKIRILGSFTAASNGISPSVSQLAVNYTGVPELGTNYQVVQSYKIAVSANRLSKKSVYSSIDSISQGDILGVKCRIYNVGGSKAESVKVKTNVAWQNNQIEELETTTVDSIPALGYRELSFTYNSSAGFGNRTFQIFIDPDNRIAELFKDNNYYSIPFVVLRDTLRPQLVDVFFDGNHIQNGDYVSASPTIDINVRDDGALPILDTATVSISLDEKRVYYNLNTALSLVPGSTTKEMTVRFRPALDKGEHQLGLNVKDRSGNFFDSTEHVITFSVDPQLKVEELFNYPNPFARQTYFAFKLTQVPEELQIKIYTVAGRLIKAIKLTGAELVFGFNKIYWDGRDGDGDEIGNGIYLYRLIAKGADQQVALTQKLVKMR